MRPEWGEEAGEEEVSQLWEKQEMNDMERETREKMGHGGAMDLGPE